MKSRYTITVTNNETGEEEIIEAANGVVLSMDKSSDQEFTEAIQEDRHARPMVAVRLFQPSDLDLLLIEDAFGQRMQMMKQENPTLNRGIQDSVMQFIKEQRDGFIVEKMSESTDESKRLMERLFGRE